MTVDLTYSLESTSATRATASRGIAARVLDLAIDPTTGDLEVLADGTLATVENEAAIAQEIQTRLRWFRGEWFLDTSRGVPYLESVLKKGVTAAAVRVILKKEIETVPGVARASSLDVAIDGRSRLCTITAEVETDLGETFTLAPTAVG